MQFMGKWITAFSLFIGFFVTQDHQGQSLSQGLFSRYDIKEFKDILEDL